MDNDNADLEGNKGNVENPGVQQDEVESKLNQALSENEIEEGMEGIDNSGGKDAEVKTGPCA